MRKVVSVVLVSSMLLTSVCSAEEISPTHQTFLNIKEELRLEGKELLDEIIKLNVSINGLDNNYRVRLKRDFEMWKFKTELVNRILDRYEKR